MKRSDLLKQTECDSLQSQENEYELLCAREQYYRHLSENSGKRCFREIDRLTRLFASHKLIEKQLSHRVERDNLLCVISNTLLERSSNEIDGGICWALERFSVFSGIDRACIIHKPVADSNASRTHTWCASHTAPYSNGLEGLPDITALWTDEELTNSQPFTAYIVSHEKKESTFHEFLHTHGIQSLVMAPLYSQDRFFGVLCLETINHNVTWDEDDLIAVRLLTNILVNALSRQHFDRKHRLLEEQLQIRQRMDSLGTLAGGIAHDFNNLLGAIIGNLDLLLTYEPTMSTKQRSYIQEAFQVAKRAAKLTAEIQSLSRGSINEYSCVDVYSIIHEVFTILERTTNKVIEKRIEFPPETFFVEANANQLHQVFLNLGTNAVYAIEDRGAKPGDNISITVKEYTVLQHDKTHLPPGPYVHIFFKDSGMGMSADIMRKAFDPLFTTKLGGRKGQGLGLAMVYNIITKNHKGYIDIESQVDNGTTIHLYLPVAKQDFSEQPPDLPKMLHGDETILVIEDENPVREMVTNSLIISGYSVHAAATGDEGLHIYHTHKNSINLILLDLTMPKVSGEEVYNRIISEDEQAKIIITSGHSEDAMSKFPLALGFLAKPYDLKTLGSIIRKVLDNKRQMYHVE